jgi:D-threo-aldose 1-dehydrogenase
VLAAFEEGVRHFDTAPHYGLGLSERRLGRALTHVRRDEVTVSTKVGRLLVENPSPTGNDLAENFAVPDDLMRVRDYSRDGVRRSIEDSLERLALSYVDVALVHDPEDFLEQATEESLPALAELREEGLVRAIGAGMNDWEPLQNIVERFDVDVVMVAGRWTLLDCSALPLLETCAARRVAVHAAAPFNSGLLARDDIAPDATFQYRAADDATRARALRLRDVCRRHGVELPVAALRFPLRHPAVARVVCGMRSADEVHVNARLFRQSVPEELWLELDDA